MESLHLEDRVVDLESGLVAGTDRDEHLSARLLVLLRYLVLHRGAVLSRDEILESVWGHIEAASDDSLNVAISNLRKTLGDSERPHQLVQTLPRRGYSYIGPAPQETKQDSPPVVDLPESARRHRPSTWLALTLGAALVLSVLVLQLLPERSQPSGARGEPRLVVLPFEDFSAAQDQLGFANGLTDQLLHALAQVQGLAVVARTTSYALQGSELTVGEIAQRLDVDAVLEGSVQREGASVRVIAQLIDADDESHLWSRTYDRPADDILLIQDEVAAAVTEALTRTLLPLASRPPLNVEVFERMALGRHELDKDTLEAMRTAEAHFERVIELEPDHAEAHALLANAMAQGAMLDGSQFRPNPEDPGFARYLALIGRAYELDPGHPEVLRMRALQITAERGAEAALPAYRAAVAQSPGFADAHGHLGWTLMRLGRNEEALAELQIAARLDPLNDLVATSLADAFWNVGRAEEAIARLNEGLARNPDYPRYHDKLALYLTRTGKTAEAMGHMETLRRIDPTSTRFHFRSCETLLQLGAIDAAEACASSLAAVDDSAFYSSVLEQLIAGFRRDFERQLSLLESMRGVRVDQFASMEAMLIAADDCERALPILLAQHAGFRSEAAQVNPNEITPALVTAHCLGETGARSDADRLLDATAAKLERIRLPEGPTYTSGLERAMLAAARGDRSGALDELERLADVGWRYNWWNIDRHPMLAPLANDPRFIESIRRIEAGVSQQRALWENSERRQPTDR